MHTAYIRPRRRRSGGWLKWLVLASGLIAMAAGMWAGWLRFVPNGSVIKPNYGMDHPIVYRGEVMKAGAIVEGDTVKLPFPVIQDTLGLKNKVVYEQATGSIVLTNDNQVLRFRTNALTAKLNGSPYALRVAAEVKDGTAYIPSTPLEQLYGIRIDVNQATGLVTVMQAGDAVQQAAAPADTVIRSEPTIRAPIVERITADAKVRIWGEREGWYRVQSADGQIGYAAKNDLTLTTVEQTALPQEPPAFTAWKLIGSKINMTWEAVYQKTPTPAQIGSLPGVNVVSPTWFELIDNAGHLQSKADMTYVNWAHSQGKQVWAVVSNGFEPDRTTAALASETTRFQMIQQILAFAEMYHLQGINLDFENVKTSDKDHFVQFVRELTPLLHEQGLVVSIDVTPKSGSELWSKFLDRAALGQVVDYMMLMAYDEHWASSPTAGSVASLPWVEQSLNRILQEDLVPPAKLVLGMPLYTRVWTEKKDASGAVKVSSKALGMDAVAQIIKDRNLKPAYDAKSGQHYVEYTVNGALQRIWIEDGFSIQARIAIAKKYGLAGVATWQRAFQTDSIWNVIQQSLTKFP
ncbi:glycosyl hydrolase family 18 protein [Paenibacillus humicola]|uniref:glycosyl hydrolase family 18 protein n=1 Tax=Paenibacillus humicola TaxID=3110540 RepID=UPI00237A9F73|nr:glycosyl hydrolase family 18 protein [Paenibacillus humicola]